MIRIPQSAPESFIERILRLLASYDQKPTETKDAPIYTPLLTSVKKPQITNSDAGL